MADAGLGRPRPRHRPRAVLLSPAVNRLGTASGPLTIGYAVVLLPDQALMATNGAMDDGMDSGMGSGMDGGIGIDSGTVAIAVLILASGVVMALRRDMVARNRLRLLRRQGALGP